MLLATRRFFRYYWGITGRGWRVQQGEHLMGMIEQLAVLAGPLLNIPVIRRIRRNHGLEHATIHMLAQGRRNLRVAGRSDSAGFYLYGDVSTAEVARAADEALRRLRNGQHELALHPNCGTNLLTTGTLATLAAMAGLAGAEDSAGRRAERFPTILLMVIATLIFSPALGMALQRHFTTLGDPGELEITAIEQRVVNTPFGGEVVVHRVTTTGG